MSTDLKTFKEEIRQKIKESEFENTELYTKWRQIKIEQDTLKHFYKPKNKLTLKGFIKVCPNDGSELTDLIVARQWNVFGDLWEYKILFCSNCGYEYADVG